MQLTNLLSFTIFATLAAGQVNIGGQIRAFTAQLNNGCANSNADLADVVRAWGAVRCGSAGMQVGVTLGTGSNFTSLVIDVHVVSLGI
jgi:hypothetical protein